MLVFVFFWTVGEYMGTAPRPTVLAPAPSPSLPLPLSPSPSRSMFLFLSLSLSLSLSHSVVAEFALPNQPRMKSRPLVVSYIAILSRSGNYEAC